MSLGSKMISSAKSFVMTPEKYKKEKKELSDEFYYFIK